MKKKEKGLYNTPGKVQESLQKWEQESGAENDCSEAVFPDTLGKLHMSSQ